MPLRLALGGMMGTGKTTVGRALARFLNVPFYDLDREVEHRAGRSIPDLFHHGGEEHFRRWERETLRSLLNRWAGPGILSLGGGTLMDPTLREALQRAGITVVVLEAPLDVLQRRLAGDTRRPLRHRLETLLRERLSVYARYPRVHAVGSVRWVAARVLAPLPLHPPTPIARRPHPVILGDGHLPEGGIVLTHPHLARGWNLPEPRILLPPGERYKTLHALERLTRNLLQMGADRSRPLVVIGGGVIGDLGGLLGALFGRGMPVELWSTTLLAAVDAHIGGKTGVNVEGKNVLGVVRFPQKVQVDPRFFLTLPRKYWLEGVVELLKVLALTRRDFPDVASEILRDMAGPSYPGAVRWIPEGVRAKLRWVRQDPEERKGIRVVLNLGHTLGHALEAASGFRVRHGHAVAWGMIQEARIGVRLGLTPPHVPETLEALFTALGVLPRSVPRGVGDRVVLDKKRRGNTLWLPLLRNWGEVTVVPVPWSLLRDASP